MLVVDRVHLLDAVEPADDVGRGQILASLDAAAADLLDEADVAALVAPRLVDDGRIQRHPRQPGTGTAVHPVLLGADHPLGNLPLPTLVEELAVRRKVLEELAGRKRLAALVVGEVNLRESVAPLVAQMPGHVLAEDELVHRVGAGDAVAGEEVALPPWEDQCLLPATARLATGGGRLVFVPLLHGDEVLALDDAELQLLRLGADLGQLHVALGQVAVNAGVARVAMVGGLRVRPLVVPAGLQQEVGDGQPEALVAGAGLLVDERAAGDAADVPLGVDLRQQTVGLDSNDGALNGQPRRGHGRTSWPRR